MTKKRIKIRSAKNKGIRFQKKIAEQIGILLAEPVGKDELISSRPMGQAGTDISIKGHCRDLFSYAVECKKQEKINIWACIDQAKSNIEGYKNWLLFVCKNRYKPFVVMDVDHFFKLQRELIELRILLKNE